MGTLKSEQFDWTDERIANLRAMHAEGLAFSRIGRELGVSRSAAIGKAQRLKLPARGKNPTPPRKPRHRPVKRVPWQPSASLAAPPPPEPMPDVPDEQIPVAQWRTFMQLENHQCRWPLPGDPVEFYCGHESANLIEGRVYCAMHTARAHQPSARRLDSIPTWGVRQPRSTGRARA